MYSILSPGGAVVTALLYGNLLVSELPSQSEAQNDDHHLYSTVNERTLNSLKYARFIANAHSEVQSDAGGSLCRKGVFSV